MTEFKKNEKIKIISAPIDNKGTANEKTHTWLVGERGVIVTLDYGGRYGIQFNKSIILLSNGIKKGHNCGGDGKDGFCFYIDSEHIRKTPTNWK